MLATGNKVERELDFSSPGEMGLYLQRTYNHYWAGAGLFGKHWVSNFDYKLTFGSTALNSCYPRPGGGFCALGSNTVIYAWRPDGRTIKYIRNATDGVFYEDKASPISRIVQDASGAFNLYNEGNGVEHYTPYGYIWSVKNEQGIGWSYTYNGSNPTRVTHTSGRYVEFTWNSNQLIAVRDPAGNQYGFAYHANQFGTGLHRLASSSQPASPITTVTYHYELPARPTALTGKSFNGVRYSRFAYDSSGRATSSEHNGADKHTLVYTLGLGGLLTVVETNPLGKQTTYVFKDGKSQSVAGHASTYCPATVALTEYDANGYPAMTSDFNGNNTAFTHNAKGQLIEKIEAYGTPVARKTTYVWDSARNRLTSFTVGGTAANSQLLRVSYTYTADNRIATVTRTNLSAPSPANNLNQAQTATYAYTKHANGLLKTMTVDGPLSGTGDRITYTYDATGQLTSVANSANHSTVFSGFNGLGQPGKVTGPNGDVIEYTYDARGRVTRMRTKPNGSAAADRTYAYNAAGLPGRITTPDGHYTDYGYDNNRRLTSLAQPDDVGGHTAQLSYAYNLASDVVSATVSRVSNTPPPPTPPPGGNPPPPDDQGGCDPVTGICTVPRGLPLAGLDGGMHPMSSGGAGMYYRAYTDYDELSRVRAQRGNNSQNVRYAYDANGNVQKVTDSLGKITTLTYDALNRVVTSKDPLGGTTKFEYDLADRVVKVTDPRNRATTYTYDGLGQLWRQVSPDTGTTTFSYNAGGQRTQMTRADGSVTTYGYDSLGRMTSAVAGGQSRTYSYDTCTHGKGRLCGMTDPSGGSSSFTYAADGRLASRRDRIMQGSTLSDDTTTWHYDTLGRLNAITYPGNVAVGYGYSGGRLRTMTVNIGGTVTNVVTATTYQPLGPASGWTYGNGLTRSLTRDLDGRLTAVATKNGAANVQSLGYGYDANNRIIGLTNHANTSLSQTYGYDVLSRLTKVTASGANQDFVWDKNGNRTSHTWGGATDTYTTATTSNRLTDIAGPRPKSFTTNANGNLTSNAGAAYAYDPFNRLKTATKSGVSSTYTVNAQDQRSNKTVGSTHTRLIYAGQNQVLAENKAGTWTYYLWFNGELVGLVRGTTRYFVHTDHLGRPELATNTAKAVVWRASNYAFDRTVTLDSIGGLNLGFPGQYHDSETGLWYNGHRDYDASIGRYIQSDPIGLAGGLNTYAYVMGNPISFVDPLGLEAPGSFNNGGHKLTWEHGANVRAPDYIRINVSIFVFKTSRTVSRSGNMYVAGGVVRPYSPQLFTPQASISIGWLNQCELPENSRVDDHLTGYSMAGAAAYRVVGGGVAWSPGSGTSTEIGLGIGGGLSPGEVGVQDGSLGGGWRW